SLMLTCKVEKIEQRWLVIATGRQVFDDQRAGRERRLKVRLGKRPRSKKPRARLRRPDCGEMALPRAAWADQRDHRRWPIRPARDERVGITVERSNHEILARKALR